MGVVELRKGGRKSPWAGRSSLLDGCKEVGFFRGFAEGGLEFHAVLAMPYQRSFQGMAMHGQFVVVRLESDVEALLGRIISVSAPQAARSAEAEPPPDVGSPDAPAMRSKERPEYRVSIRLLGVLRLTEEGVVFAASHRRLPHVGSPVYFLSPDLLREVVGHNAEGTEIGFLALGEFVYAHGDGRLDRDRYPWMRVVGPTVLPKFDARHLVARKTFVFARAGFGKSNHVKLLFSSLFKMSPTVTRGDGRRAPVGGLLWDPEGEYFWPDVDGRPGFCDVPELQDKVVVFTDRPAPSAFYGSFVACGVRMDLRRLSANEVLAVAMGSDKQDQANIKKLRNLSSADWRKLVDEVHAKGPAADEDLFMKLLHLKDTQEMEMLAAKSNMVHMVRMLHSPGSPFLDMVFDALEAGKLCVVDLSMMRGTPALTLSGLTLQAIFERNQVEHTRPNSRAIPVVTVVEEAQAVLGSSASSGDAAYVAWVKEGRKFGCGAVLITQQPGSIPNEILSQGDSWFIFHLLSAGDLQAVRKANAHFSEDVLSSLLNEPIHGQGVFWSSSAGRSFPIPIRTLLFEEAYRQADPGYDRGAVPTASALLRERFREMLVAAPPEKASGAVAEEGGEDVPPDPFDMAVGHAIKGVKDSGSVLSEAYESGVPWMRIQALFEEGLPSVWHDRKEVAFRLMPQVLNEVFGQNGWTSEKRGKKGGGTTTYVVARNER